jgi:hypothetical protein
MTIRKNSKASIRARALILLALTLSGCLEVPTRVKVEGGDVPAFALFGTGNLASFSVSSLPPEEKLLSRDQIKLLWKLVAQPNNSAGRPLRDIGKLTYGTVPDGYKQVFPEKGAPPERIVPNARYSFYCDTTNAPHAGGLFMLTSGHATKLDEQVPCFEERDGKSVKVPCKK